MSAWWVMPFERNCTITLTNYGEQPVEISKAAAVSGKWQWDERSMHFWYHMAAVLRISMPGAMSLPRTFTFADLKGRGVYVGDAVTVYNPNLGWWGEGDERCMWTVKPFRHTLERVQKIIMAMLGGAMNRG